MSKYCVHEIRYIFTQALREGSAWWRHAMVSLSTLLVDGEGGVFIFPCCQPSQILQSPVFETLWRSYVLVVNGYVNVYWNGRSLCPIFSIGQWVEGWHMCEVMASDQLSNNRVTSNSSILIPINTCHFCNLLHITTACVRYHHIQCVPWNRLRCVSGLIFYWLSQPSMFRYIRQRNTAKRDLCRNGMLAVRYSILDIGHSNVQCYNSNIQLTSRSWSCDVLYAHNSKSPNVKHK